MKFETLQKYAGWVLLGLLLVASLAWAFWPRALLVEEGRVSRGRFEQTIVQDGRLRVQNRYVISAPTAAELMRISLKVGDRVLAAQVVATLTPVAPQMIDARTRAVLLERVGSAQGARAAAQAQLLRQQTALEQAQLEAQRTQKLASENFVSASARDQAALNLQAQQRATEAALAEAHVAEHSLSEARAALAASEGRAAPGGPIAGRWDLTSPTNGRIIKIHQESGGPVAVGQPLLEVADTALVDAVIDVLSGDAMRIRTGTTVRLAVGSGVAPLEGRVARIEPVAFTKVSALGIEEQRVNVIVQLQPTPAQQAVLGEGYRVDATLLVSAQDDALLVPGAALVRDGEQWRVFVVEGGHAKRRAVRVRERNAETAWVQDGVTPGERVLLYPDASLIDGQKVQTRAAGD